MARERMPNFVARKSKWTAVFRSGWFVFWPATVLALALIIICLNTFWHPLQFLSSVFPGLGHTVYKVDRVEPTCTEEGNVQYYTCWKCDNLYTDRECTQKIEPAETVIPIVEHNLVHNEGVDSTYIQLGIKEHWSCVDCLQTFEDDKATKPLDDVVIPLKVGDATTCTHVYKKHIVIECGGKDKFEYYTCEECNNAFTKSEYAEEYTYFELAEYTRGHKLEFVPAKESTCEERGYPAHYKCTDKNCKKLYSDPNGRNEVLMSDLLLTYDHNMDHGVLNNSAKPLISDNTHLYFCWECERMFADYEGEREVMRPMNVNLFGMSISIWTIAAVVYTLIYIIVLIWTFVIIKSNYIEFYDDYVIQNSGVFFRRSRKSIFPQITRVSTRKHFLNYGDILIDVVGPWDIDFVGIARPEELRSYLLDHMVNSAAVENISSNPYLAVLATTPDTLFPGDIF